MRLTKDEISEMAMVMARDSGMDMKESGMLLVLNNGAVIVRGTDIPDVMSVQVVISDYTRIDAEIITPGEEEDEDEMERFKNNLMSAISQLEGLFRDDDRK